MGIAAATGAITESKFSRIGLQPKVGKSESRKIGKSGTAGMPEPPKTQQRPAEKPGVATLIPQDQRTLRMIPPPWRMASSLAGSIFQARSGSDFFRPTITFSIETTGRTLR